MKIREDIDFKAKFIKCKLEDIDEVLEFLSSLGYPKTMSGNNKESYTKEDKIVYIATNTQLVKLVGIYNDDFIESRKSVKSAFINSRETISWDLIKLKEWLYKE